MPVHMLGNPCDMEPILEIAQRHRVCVLEDACQALGGSYRGRRLGTLGRMGAFSLNIFKTITAGDGGAVVTDDTELYRRAFAIHDQGHLPQRTGVEVGERSILGLNFRMNELTGAVALDALRKLDRLVATLREKKARLKEQIAGIPGVGFRRLPDPGGECATLLHGPLRRPGEGPARGRSAGNDHRGPERLACLREHGARRSLAGGAGPAPREGGVSRTDGILGRAVNLSVGVVDAGLGAASASTSARRNGGSTRPRGVPPVRARIEPRQSWHDGRMRSSAAALVFAASLAAVASCRAPARELGGGPGRGGGPEGPPRRARGPLRAGRAGAGVRRPAAQAGPAAPLPLARVRRREAWTSRGDGWRASSSPATLGALTASAVRGRRRRPPSRASTAAGCS